MNNNWASKISWRDLANEEIKIDNGICWEDKNGNLIPLKFMDDQYLLNIFKFTTKKREEGYRYILDSTYDGIVQEIEKRGLKINR